MIEKDRDDQHYLKSSTNKCNSQYTLVLLRRVMKLTCAQVSYWLTDDIPIHTIAMYQL